MNFKNFGAMLTVAAMSLAHAAPVTLSLTTNGGVGTYGNVLTFSNGPVTATVTSWSLLTALGTFGQAATGQWGVGLGVCNSSETTANCGSPNHTMDNKNGTDFILFQFNTSVDPISLTPLAFQTGDSDISYWTGNTSSSTTLLSGQTLAGLGALGFGGQQESLDNTATNPRTVNLVSGNVNALLVSANLANIDQVCDYIKLSSLTVAPGSEVPEPGTMALMGLALAGLGSLRLRRRG